MASYLIAPHLETVDNARSSGRHGNYHDSDDPTTATTNDVLITNCLRSYRMRFPDDITRILDVLLTLLQSSLWVIVVTERVRHASVALHSHRIACRLEELAVFMRLIPAEIILCRDDVGSRHAFEGLCKYRRRHPVIQRSFAQLCVYLLVTNSVGSCSLSPLACAFGYPVVHEPVHTRSRTPGIMLHHRNTRILLRYF